MEDDKNQNIQNLISDVKGIEFSYFDGEEWHREWSFSNRWKAASGKPVEKVNLFPGLVRLELKWEDKKLFKVSYDFAVSHSFLRSHYPGRDISSGFFGYKAKEKTGRRINR